MTLRRLVLLACVAAAAHGLLRAIEPATPLPGPTSAREAATQGEGESPAGEAALAARAAMVVDVDLFRPAAAAPLPPVDPMRDARLLGIIEGAETVALLSLGEAGAPLRLRHGDRPGGWAVTAIGRKTVVLTKDGAQLELRLDAAPQPTAGP